MGEIKKDEVLAKVTPDRRRFVETMLALTGYVTPTVRSFLMASATTPIFARPTVTTTQNGQGQNGQGNQGGNGQGNQGQNQQNRQGNRPGLIDRQLQRTGPKKR